MEPTTLIVGAVCAITAVLVAFMVDRDNWKRRREQLKSAPGSPGVDAPTPAYVTAEEVAAEAKRTPAHAELTPAERDHVDRQLARTEPLAAGLASPDFVTDQAGRRAILDNPIVLVTPELLRFSDLHPVVRRARDQAAPGKLSGGLAVVVQKAAPEPLATLAMNALSGRLDCVVVTTDDLEAVAAGAGAQVIEPADLTAGYIPAGSLGSCDLWVSDRENTWIVRRSD